MEVLVLEGNAFQAQQKVNLFQIPVFAAIAAHVLGPFPAAVLGRRQGVEGLLRQLHKPPVVKIAGGGEDDIGRRIMIGHVIPEHGRGHGADPFHGAQHRTAEGLFGKRGFLEEIEDHVVGGVLGLVDFLHDHVLLAGQFVGVHDRMLQNVGDDIDGQGQVFLQDLGVIRGVFAGRVGVQVPADGLDLLGDFQGAAAFGPLEGHVLQQVRNAVDGGGFVPGADLDPGAERYGFHRIHGVRDDAKAAGKFRDLDGHAASLSGERSAT